MSAFFTLDKALVKRILWFTMLVSSAAFGTCNPGTYASGTACVNAPVGYYVPSAGATGPTPCPPGTWQNNAGQSHCVVAGSGTYVSGYAAGSASTCTGSYSTSVAGTYSPGGNIHTWPDQYTTVGPTSCTPAVAGYYIPTSGATSVAAQMGPCNAGYYAPLGSATCIAAPAGYYVPSAGASGAIPCPPGTWQNNAGQNHCVIAGSNTYSPYYGSTGASGCPAGTSSVSVAGQYSSGGNIHTWPDQYTTVGPTTCAVMTQVQCNPGYYAQPGAAACSAVPAGFYTPSAGATAPIPCPPGTWQKNGAQNHCVVAGSNTYVSSYAAGAANGCPAGTSSVSVAGQYVSGGSIHTWPDQFTTVGPTTCN